MQLLSLSNYFAHTSSTLSLRATTIDLRLRVEAHAQRRQMTRRRSRKRERDRHKDKDKETKNYPKISTGSGSGFWGTHTVGSLGLTVCLVDCMRTEVLVPSKQLRGNSAETKGQRESWASGWASLSLQI